VTLGITEAFGKDAAVADQLPEELLADTLYGTDKNHQ